MPAQAKKRRTESSPPPLWNDLKRSQRLIDLWRDELEDRFNRQVRPQLKVNGAQCLEFQGAKRRGYGYITVRNGDHIPQKLATHQLVYCLHHGPILDNHVVMHSCDNPACCNPDHISLGTIAENSADMARKGRSLKGERNAGCKLTAEQVREIPIRVAQGATYQELALEYGVHKSRIGFIMTGRNWEWLLQQGS